MVLMIILEFRGIMIKNIENNVGIGYEDYEGVIKFNGGDSPSQD